ncbi:MAG: molybdenum cofactor guanylyltransferase [Defluviitaleaceae bacterium]|nr:molybdenum cofactor guanylyltransferase [Defluviitaleaceae bacterium]
MKKFGDAVILCGGKSSRMGFDKSLIKTNNMYIIEKMYRQLSKIFENVRLSATGDISKFKHFNIDIIKDTTERLGPCGAIYSSLLSSFSKYLFVIACDMPLINIEHINYMKQILDTNENIQALVPINGIFKETLYSFYSVECIPFFEQVIEKKIYKMQNILDLCNTRYMEEEISVLFDSKLSMFTNLNYNSDFTNFMKNHSKNL